MRINIQCHPTPIQWLGRKPPTEPEDGAGATGSYLSAAWDYMLVVSPSTNTERTGACSCMSVADGCVSFANGDVNINSPSQSESSTSLSSAPTFAWDSITVQGPNQSEAAGAAGSSSPVFSWDSVTVNGPGQSESAGALAADPSFNNGP